MVLLESAIIAGLGYTAYSVWSVRSAMKNETGVKQVEGAAGVEFYKETTKRGFSFLINAGIVILPIGFGDVRDEEYLHSQCRLTDGTVLTGVRTWDNEQQTIHVADTEKGLQELMAAHSILSRPFSNVPPIIAYSYDLRGRPVWYDVKAGVISTNKQWVVRHAGWARRPPMAITVVAGLAVLAAGEAIKHSYSSVLSCDCLICKYRGGAKRSHTA